MHSGLAGWKQLLTYMAMFAGWPMLLGQHNSGTDIFDHLTTKDGLSYSRVRSFYQDKTGFIWVGTESGLNRYDGYGFTVFKHMPEEAGSLLHNSVPALLEDSRERFWIGTRAGLQLLDSEKSIFFPEPEDDAHPLAAIGHVLALREDRAGRLWVGTAEGLFCLTLPEESILSTEKLQRLYESGRLKVKGFFADPTVPDGLNHNRIWTLAEDRAGYLWIGTEAGLHRYDPGTQSITRWSSSSVSGTEALSGISIRALQEDERGRLWVGTAEGLYRLSADRSQAKIFKAGGSDNSGLRNNFITQVTLDGRGQLWIGTDGGGLSKWDPVADRLLSLLHDPNNPASIKDNNIEALYADRDGGLWIGHHKGISYWNRYRKPFHYLGVDGRQSGLSPGTIACFAERPDGNLWVGVDDGGLSLYNRETGTFRQLQHEPGNLQSLRDNDVISILEDSRGTVWVGSWGGGLSKFVPGSSRDSLHGVFTHYHPDAGPGNFPAEEVWTVYEDRRARIWIGTVDDGLIHYDPASGDFQSYQQQADDARSLLHNWVLDIREDEAGQLWVATTGGLSRLDRDGRFTNFPLEEQGEALAVYDLLPGLSGALWLGTRQGLKLFDSEKGILQSWRESDGLSDNFVSCMLKDDQGYLWLGTGKGLSKFHPSSHSFRNYDESDGLQAGEFTGAHLKTRTGEFVFGGINGFNIFYPDSIRDQPLAPAVVITDFKMFNRSVPVSGAPGDTLSFPSPLTCNSFATREVRLRHWQNDISFEFAALNYLNPEKNRYKYRLEGYREEWMEAEAGQNIAFYTSLPSGEYTFRVIGTNNDGIWNEEGAALNVIIAAPWWNTWWAYFLYALVLGGIFFFLRRNQLNRQYLKRDLELKRLQAKQLKELDETKSRLYTNITHEFRTPLTVILGMADQLEHGSGTGLKDGLNLIRRNGRSLLAFVNQMLDLAKLQSNQMNLEFIQGDVVAFLKYITESFHSMAAAKNLRVTVHSEPGSIMMDFDRNKLTQILSNLLSNAIKFTPPGGEISLQIGLEKQKGAASRLIFSVSDTGIGIPENQQSQIFDRFFQAASSGIRKEAGTGIGLALTKELVKLLEGDIQVESSPERGSIFTVRLPVKREAPLEEVLPDTEAISQIQASAETMPMPELETAVGDSLELPLLLIIEDNPDVQRFLLSFLRLHYRLLTAENGRTGIEKAVEQVPDIIISDVMMPEKDGFELCDTLKKDTRTSHIPIILLTARATVEDRIAGLERGADAYMAKPFHQAELLTRLQNLLDTRRRLQERYLNLDKPVRQSTADERVEDTFLLELRQTIEREMLNSTFSIQYLCRQMVMSRMQLHRKIKALTGRSTSLYIRSVRLQRARSLLSSTDLNISEVAYEVGFDDPKYFSRVFSEEFGMSPTVFREGESESD